MELREHVHRLKGWGRFLREISRGGYVYAAAGEVDMFMLYGLGKAWACLDGYLGGALS